MISNKSVKIVCILLLITDLGSAWLWKTAEEPVKKVEEPVKKVEEPIKKDQETVSNNRVHDHVKIIQFLLMPQRLCLKIYNLPLSLK